MFQMLTRLLGGSGETTIQVPGFLARRPSIDGSELPLGQ